MRRRIADADDAANGREKVEERLDKAFGADCAPQAAWQREQDRERANALLDQRDGISRRGSQSLAKAGAGTLMTRIHGDFHLGQVLVASGDAYIIDFEGEPATSIAERRAKTSPLRDVAGLLRSIDYAGAALMDRKDVGAVPIDEAQRDEFIARNFDTRASQAFLHDYWEASSAPQQRRSARALLDLFLIEKAAYEIAYEAANRPTWIGVPLAGLSRLRDADSRARRRWRPQWLTRGSRPSWRLDPESARALAHGRRTAIPSPCSGRTTRADGRVIRAFLPGAIKVEVLRRSDGASSRRLSPANEDGLFENLDCRDERPIGCGSFGRDAVQETEDPYSFGLLLGDHRSAFVQRGPAFRTGAMPRRADR